MRRALTRTLGAVAGAAFLGLLAYDLVMFFMREPAFWFEPIPEPIPAEMLGWLVFGLAVPALLLTPLPRGRIPYWGEWIAASVTAAGFALLLLTLPWRSTWSLGQGDLAALRILWAAMIGAYPAVLLMQDVGEIVPSRAMWVRAVLYAALLMVPWVYFEASGAMRRSGKPFDPMTWRAGLDALRFVALVVAFRYLPRLAAPAAAPAPAEPAGAPDAEPPPRA